MSFNELMSAFCAKFGLGGANTDPDGTVTLSADGVVMNFSYDRESDVVTSAAELGEPPAVGAELFFRQMLAANFPGQGLSGTTLALDDDSGRLCVLRRDPLEWLDLPRFVAAVDGLANDAIAWARLLEDYRPLGQTLSAAETADGVSPGAAGECATDFIRV